MPIDQVQRLLVACGELRHLGLQHHRALLGEDFAPERQGRRIAGAQQPCQLRARTHCRLQHHVPATGTGVRRGERCDQGGLLRVEGGGDARDPRLLELGEVVLVHVPAHQGGFIEDLGGRSGSVEPGIELCWPQRVVPGAAQHHQVEVSPVDLGVGPVDGPGLRAARVERPQQRAGIEHRVGRGEACGIGDDEAEG
ncbi:hypothetical protein ACT3TE_07955 [Brachybacterium sp. AOP42-B2-9]|uniref:hypothetical protein n=1 Tax=Brachybacterium sp. AOP42-B2-9 TaxID=3457672 RepID=UPI0040341954